MLVDFENIQPTDLALLKNGPFKVVIFLGSNQSKIPVGIAMALQQFGAAAEYLQIEGNGSNALDFHIAYSIGRLVAAEPESWFHVISKDTGFDPLIKHLVKQKLHVTRQTTIKQIPLLAVKTSATASFDDKLDAILTNLKAKKAAKPAKQKTLASTIHSIFAKSLSEDEVNVLIEELARRGWISVQQQKVTYSLPS
ncbi:MAG: PIN domain-containing protein [Stagnimonas sp.]|nr:PIN domain-containing protein [Stagnimonas sp.]